MASRNERYATVLTQGALSALSNPPRVTPVDLSAQITGVPTNERRFIGVTPEECRGFCVGHFLANFRVKICFNRDSDCLITNVDSYFNQVETSECLGEGSEELGRVNELVGGSNSYREYSNNVSYSDNCVTFSGEVFEIKHPRRVCDVCKNPGPCVSTQTISTNQQHTTCKTKTQDKPSFPSLGGDVPEFYYSAPEILTGVSWIFRETLKRAMDEGMFLMEHDLAACNCTTTTATTPDVIARVATEDRATVSGSTVKRIMRKGGTPAVRQGIGSPGSAPTTPTRTTSSNLNRVDRGSDPVDFPPSSPPSPPTPPSSPSGGGY